VQSDFTCDLGRKIPTEHSYSQYDPLDIGSLRYYVIPKEFFIEEE
jgi:hypothetical protein